MKLGIIISDFGQAGVDTKTGLEHISRIGFDAVDIFTEAMTITEDEVNLIKSTCEENNLPITSTVVVSAGLIDFNDPVRDYHITRAKKFLDLAKTFDSKNLLLFISSSLLWGIHPCYSDPLGFLQVEPQIQLHIYSIAIHYLLDLRHTKVVT